MKILRKGALEGKTVQRECTWCETVIEAARSEFNKSYSVKMGGCYLKCPTCGKAINY